MNLQFWFIWKKLNEREVFMKKLANSRRFLVGSFMNIFGFENGQLFTEAVLWFSENHGHEIEEPPW